MLEGFGLLPAARPRSLTLNAMHCSKVRLPRLPRDTDHPLPG